MNLFSIRTTLKNSSIKNQNHGNERVQSRFDEKRDEK